LESGKRAGLGGGQVVITQVLPAGSPFLLFPESKNPGREMVGIFNKSPKNKEILGKIGLQIEDYL